jgi:tetratricopeptide (TPR) repeat protein
MTAITGGPSPSPAPCYTTSWHSTQPHQDGTLSNAVANEISQLTTHLGTVFRKLEKKEATSRLAKELAGTLFSAAPFPTVPALLLGLKDAPSTIMQLLKALGTPIGDAGETQFADSSGSQGDLLDRWIPALAAALGAASVPLVIFLDDAHWADPSTIDFLDRLLIANPATLVVATAWPDLLDVQSDGGQRLDAGSFIGRWKDRLTIRRLASLSDVQLTQIAARALDLFPASPIATQLGQRAANNPLLLRLWAGLAPVARSAAAGRALSEADLRDLPDNALDAFNQRWNELPSHVRLVLAAGADQGFEFVPEVLAEALVGAGLTRIPAEASTALEQAPHWVRAVGGVQQFTEPTLYEVARGAKDSLSRTEQRLLRQAFCTALPIIKSNRRWNEFSIRGRSAVLAAHIRATDQHGQGGVEDAAARIVDSHRELASFQPESQSGWRAAAELLLEATTLLSSDSSRDRRTLLSLWDQHATILLRMGRADDALPLFQRALADSVEWLDPLHPDALRTRGNLADCLEAVGRASDALPLHEQTFLERQLTLGVDHLETLASWRNVARCLATVGRLEEALEMFESLVTNADRVLGPNGQLTISARSELAARYYEAGRTMEAVGVLEQVVQDSEESLGPEHPDTIRAKADLATCNGNAGLVAKAVAMMEETLGQFDRTLGVCHPDSIRARGNLAFLYGELGRIGDAIVMEERALEDRERILGPNHRDTITSRNNLAASYQSAGRSLEATLMRERVLAESERVNGPEHPDTTLARSNLAASYQATGRTLEAITMKELVLAERKRLFGVDHPDTLKASANLAVSYRLDGRISKAIAIEERVLADRERVLGHEHPDTLTTRANLTVSYRQAGRTQEAVVIGEQVLADRERILGSDHPDTLKARAILASSYYQDGRIQEAVAIGELVPRRTRSHTRPRPP